MQTMTKTATETPAVSLPPMPDGDMLGNDILASIGKRETARLLRHTGKNTKARKNAGQPPQIMFQPRGWTMGGRVD